MTNANVGNVKIKIEESAVRAAADLALLNYLEQILLAQGKTPPTDLAGIVVDLAAQTTGTVRDVIGNLLVVALRCDPMPWES